MKKILKSSALITLTMVIFLSCIFTSKHIIEVDALEDITLTNLNEKGEIFLDFEDNYTKEIKSADPNYKLTQCYVYNVADSSFDYSSNTCTLTASNFGLTFLEVHYQSTNSENYQDFSKKILIDVDSERYLDTVVSKIPDEIIADNLYSQEVYNKIYPNALNVGSSYDSNKCTYANQVYTCPITYSISLYNQDTQSYINRAKSKTIKIKKTIQTMPILYETRVDVGQTKQISMNNQTGYLDPNKYIFASEDNTIASISWDGNIEGKMPGETIVRLYNKETLKYSEAKVIVKQETMNPKEFKAYFEQDRTIDLDYGSTEQLISYEWNFETNSQMVNYANTLQNYMSSYFNKVSASNSYFNTSNETINCSGNSCQMHYSINCNGNTTYASTGLITINVAGIRVDKTRYADKGGNVYLDSYASTLNKQGITVNYDENFFNKIENTRYEILKLGETEVTYISEDGHMATTRFIIDHTNEDINEINSTFYDLKSLTLPYNKLDFDNNLKYLSSIVNKTILNSISDANTAKKYLQVKTNCYFSGVCQVEERIVYPDNQSNGGSNRSVKIEYNNLTTNESIAKIKQIDSTIRDNYIVSLSDTLALENRSTNEEDFYNNLITKTDILSKNTDEVKITATKKANLPFNNYIKGGASYEITYSINNSPLYERNITVSSDHIIDSTGLTSDEDNAKIEFIKNKIKADLSKDVTVTKLEDNYYKIDNKYNIILDKKEDKKISSISFSNTYTELKIGEEKELKYTVYPLFANIGEIKFKSLDESVATVSETGVVTGKSKGYTVIKSSVNYSSSSTFVLIDMTPKEMLDDLITKYSKNLELQYGDINNGMEEALRNAIQNKMYAELNITGPITIEVTQENDKYYATINIYPYSWGGATVDRVSSIKQEIDYRLIGIRIKENKVELKKNTKYDTELYFSEGDLRNLIITSSNPSVATIDKNGIITSINPGITYINISDKYQQYYNYITVYVDKEAYFEKNISEAHAHPITIEGHRYSMSNSSCEGCTKPTRLKRIEDEFDNVISSKLNLYEYYQAHRVECNESSSTCRLDLKNDYNGPIVRSESFRYELLGIFLEDYEEKKLSLNEIYTPKYKVYPSTNTVTLTSLEPNICTVSGNSITAVAPGICPVEFTTNEGDKSYQFMVIEEDKIIESLQNQLNNMSNTIELKNEKFDKNLFGENAFCSNENPEYCSYTTKYNTQIIKKIKSELNIPKNYTVYYNNDLITMSDTDTTNVNMDISYNYDDSNLNYYYYHSFGTSLSKTFHYTYGEVPEELNELGKKIEDKIPALYDLTLMQVLRFQMDKGQDREVLKYSSLEDDIKSICSDCTYVIDESIGFGGMGDETFFQTPYMVGIYKDEYPIAGKLFDVRARFNITLEDAIVSEQEIINMIKAEVKDAYIKLKGLFQPKAKIGLRRASAYSLTPQADNPDDIEVEVTKEYTDEGKGYYKVQVEEVTFNADVGITLADNVQVEYTQDPIKNISLKTSTLYMTPNSENTITATITADEEDYDKTITWTSSDETIATVDEFGKVTAIKNGTATITARTVNGLTASCTVVISDVLMGDVDLDGSLTLYDVLKALRVALEIPEALEGLSPANIEAGDFDKNGKIDIGDVLYVLRAYLNRD